MRSASLQFSIMTEDEARKLLASNVHTGEVYGDRVAAARRLRPVVTPEEVKQNKAYLRRHQRKRT